VILPLPKIAIFEVDSLLPFSNFSGVLVEKVIFSTGFKTGLSFLIEPIPKLKVSFVGTHNLSEKLSL
jgi:hypothetical protein